MKYIYIEEIHSSKQQNILKRYIIFYDRIFFRILLVKVFVFQQKIYSFLEIFIEIFNDNCIYLSFDKVEIVVSGAKTIISTSGFLCI